MYEERVSDFGAGVCDVLSSVKIEMGVPFLNCYFKDFLLLFLSLLDIGTEFQWFFQDKRIFY